MALPGPDERWPASPGTLARLPAEEVHVWRAALAQPAGTLAWLARLLSPDERARAERYRVEGDRHRSVIARGLLRHLVGLSLDRAPERLAFGSGEFGKPRLVLDEGSDWMEINVSHAGDWILIGLALDRPLGVDVERIRPDIDCEAIAARFFSADERRALTSLPAEERIGAFFDCWSRKEAYLKARGDGLTLALDSFDVELRPGLSPRLLATRDDPEDAIRWRLEALHPGPDHAGALAALGHDWRLRCRHWDGGAFG